MGDVNVETSEQSAAARRRAARPDYASAAFLLSPLPLELPDQLPESLPEPPPDSPPEDEPPDESPEPLSFAGCFDLRP